MFVRFVALVLALFVAAPVVAQRPPHGPWAFTANPHTDVFVAGGCLGAGSTERYYPSMGNGRAIRSIGRVSSSRGRGPVAAVSGAPDASDPRAKTRRPQRLAKNESVLAILGVLGVFA